MNEEFRIMFVFSLNAWFMPVWCWMLCCVDGINRPIVFAITEHVNLVIVDVFLDLDHRGLNGMRGPVLEHLSGCGRKKEPSLDCV